MMRDTPSMEGFKDELIKFRRHIHAHPELSFKEKETSQYICNILDEWKVEYSAGWAGFGIIATIQANVPTEDFIAIRADMDALPITEENDVPYKSKRNGVMHACGHDVHTTCLLGAIKIVLSQRQRLKRNVKFIFQPGEELLPGGASLMLKEGAIDPTKCKEIYALHVFPSLETGKIGLRSGPYMASSDELYIEVQGKGGHGGMPHLTIDPILVASHIITGIQSIVSRRCDPTIPCVLTIGKINSEGGATNIIPTKVHLEGTFRTMDEKWRAEAHSLIVTYCESVAAAHGAEARVIIKKGYPTLVNDPDMVHKAEKAVARIVGTNNIEYLPIRMTSEDFAWFTQEIKGCFFRLGTGNQRLGITAGVHSSRFDVDEDCLTIGAQCLASICFEE